MLDADLAKLYGVSTKVLNQAVRRNRKRFPEDFMFQLTAGENESLRSQIGTLKRGRRQHRKYLPYAFTEQGVAMLSSVLKSKRAVLVNIEIMRTFVRLRQLLASHAELARKLGLSTRIDGEAGSDTVDIGGTPQQFYSEPGCLSNAGSFFEGVALTPCD